MTVIQIDERTAHDYARSLIAYAQGIDAPRRTFALPGFTLNIRSDSPGYLALCERALVSDPRLAGAGNPTIDITALDRGTHPDLPMARWVGPLYGPTLVAEGLAAGGYEGFHELDYRLWQVFDPTARQGVEALSEPNRFAPWVASFPLRNFLHWAYQSAGWRIVHAGTLAHDGRGVMIVGAGGAGKSGTTLSGVLHGLDSAGDDYVAINLRDDRLWASPVMKLMKQDANGLSRLGIDPVGAGLGQPNWQNKYEFDFERFGTGRRAASIELQAILIPRIVGGSRSTLRPARPQLAMMNLAPSNLQQLPGGWREGLQFTAEIARRLPAFHLDLSEDPAEIATTIRAFIEKDIG